MYTEQIPLLSPKAFADYSAAEFKEYVCSLYVAPPEPPVKAEYAVRLNKKGNLVLTVRRDPKWLSTSEVGDIASEVGWTLQATWLAVRKRDVRIEIPDPKTRK